MTTVTHSVNGDNSDNGDNGENSDKGENSDNSREFKIRRLRTTSTVNHATVHD